MDDSDAQHLLVGRRRAWRICVIAATGAFALAACSSGTDYLAPVSTPSTAPVVAWVGLATAADPSCADFTAAPAEEQEEYAAMLLLALWDHAGATRVPAMAVVDDWTTTLAATCATSGDSVAFVAGAVMWTGYRGKYQP